METIGRIYVIDGGQVALEWIWEKSISSGKTEGYVWHTGNQQEEATFATRKALAASYVAAQSLDTLYEIREMLITKSYLSRLGSSKSEKKRVSSRENGRLGGRPRTKINLEK